MKIIKYKIIKEYDKFYLAQHPAGWKECFQKTDYYKMIKNGYVYKQVKEFSNEDMRYATEMGDDNEQISQ